MLKEKSSKQSLRNSKLHHYDTVHRGKDEVLRFSVKQYNEPHAVSEQVCVATLTDWLKL